MLSIQDLGMGGSTMCRKVDVVEARRRRLLRECDIDAFLVIHVDRLLATGVDRENLFYLSGFSGSGALLVTDKRCALLTDARYYESACREVVDVEVIDKPLGEDYLDAAIALVQERAPKRLGFSGRKTSYAVGKALHNRLPKQEVLALADPVEAVRVRKDANEVAAIRRAIAVTEDCLARLVETVKPGDKETELRRRFYQFVIERDAEFAFDPIIASGPNTAIAHHTSGDRKLQKGDLALFDIGVRVAHYVADITRTFHLGAASKQASEMYKTVLEAQEAGIVSLGPGIPAHYAKDAMQSVFRGSSFSNFSRVSGHGLGLEVHEQPYLREMEGDEISAGTILTIEPGIYIPGVGGIRIEDDVMITDEGYEVLSSYPKRRLTEIG